MIKAKQIAKEGATLYLLLRIKKNKLKSIMTNKQNLGVMPCGLPINVSKAVTLTGLSEKEILDFGYYKNILEVPKTKVCKSCGHRLPFIYFENGSENCYIC